jgi:oxygen-dependent protoporphyrinogen oxidase
MSIPAEQYVAVIGGGITGLAAAHRLRELDSSLKVTLLEASARLGGVLATQREGDYLIEQGPDMFITREPWALDLCRRIGLDSQLIGTNDTLRRALVVCRGKLHPVPEGFTMMAPSRIGPMLRTPLLSPLGKLRLGWEYLVRPRRATTDESLANFARRRFGSEAYDRLIQPLIGGIYTADPDKLSMQAAMPRFVEMEQKYGSLTKAMRTQQKQAKGKAGQQEQAASGVRYQAFVAPREGIGSLVTAVAERLPTDCIELNSPVQSIAREPHGRWSIVTSAAGVSTTNRYDALILALPAPAAARLMQPVDTPLSTELAAIPYAGASVVILAYRRSEVEHPMDGFGAVVPHKEGRRIIAISFASNKFPGRAPDDQILLRVFVGGALQPELMQLDDQATLELVEQELRELLGVRGEPLLRQVARWDGKMPQYHLGHLDRVASIEQRASELAGLELAGNAYRGVGIPFCVHSGEEAAGRVVDTLRMRSAGS